MGILSMKSSPVRTSVLSVSVCFMGLWFVYLTVGASVASTESKALNNWPQWRGPLATGVGPLADPPVTWSETENVRWKVSIPGRGHATPAVWENRVYVLSAVPVETPDPTTQQSDTPGRRRPGISPDSVLEFTLFALDRSDGSVVWRRVANRVKPHEGTHPDGSWSSGSPITDGERIFAQFGSQGLYAYDLDGKLLWSRDLGDMSTRMGFGEGTTPFLYDDYLVVLWDHEGEDFIVALDKTTGKERWRRERDEHTTWSTPVVVEVNGRPQVIVNASNAIRAYDLKTGDSVWQTSGMTANSIPSPVVADGVAYFLSGFRGANLLAIRLADAKGELAADSKAILWTHDRDTPYVPSPLVYGDALYFVKGNKGILSCLNATSGDANYGPIRLEGIEGVHASPIGAADRVYIAGRNGAVQVLRHGAEYELLALNQLEDSFDASPVAVDGELFLRGQHLYCLAQD